MLQKGVFTIEEAAGEFRADFLDQDKVRTWLFRKLNPEGPRCALCGEGVLPGKAATTFWNGGRVCCKNCGAYFTASTGTMIAGAALSEREIFLLALLLGFEVPVAEIAEILERSEETVRAWRSKLALASAVNPTGSGALITPPQGKGRAQQGAGVGGLDLAVCEGLSEDQGREFLGGASSFHPVGFLLPLEAWARGNRTDASDTSVLAVSYDHRGEILDVVKVVNLGGSDAE